MMSLEPSTIASLILAAVGIVSAGFGVRAAMRQQRPSSPDESPGREWTIPFEFKAWYGFLAASVICFILAAGALVVDLARAETMINIESHEPGDVVSYEEFVRGTSKHLPADSMIWLVVAPHGETAYYPQAEVYRIEPGGDWSTRALIGAPESSASSYDLLAILADADTYERIKAHMTDAFSGTDSPPLDELPDGAKIYDRATVVRQPAG